MLTAEHISDPPGHNSPGGHGVGTVLAPACQKSCSCPHKLAATDIVQDFTSLTASACHLGSGSLTQSLSTQPGGEKTPGRGLIRWGGIAESFPPIALPKMWQLSQTSYYS